VDCTATDTLQFAVIQNTVRTRTCHCSGETRRHAGVPIKQYLLTTAWSANRCVTTALRMAAQGHLEMRLPVKRSTPVVHVAGVPHVVNASFLTDPLAVPLGLILMVKRVVPAISSLLE